MSCTVLQNERTGETVYTQPEGGAEIRDLLGNLETYIKGADTDGIYPLIKLAVIHYQLESIHPLYNGNFITAMEGQAESSIFFTWN